MEQNSLSQKNKTKQKTNSNISKQDDWMYSHSCEALQVTWAEEIKKY